MTTKTEVSKFKIVEIDHTEDRPRIVGDGGEEMYVPMSYLVTMNVAVGSVITKYSDGSMSTDSYVPVENL